MRLCHFFLRREGVLGIGHLLFSVSSIYNFFVISASYAVNDIGGGARKVISDLNGSLGSQYFLYVLNERTSFASWASAFESSRLVIGLKWTSDQKVAYVFVTPIWMKLVEFAKRLYQSLNRFGVISSFLRMIDLTAWLRGWNVRVNKMR